MSQYTCIATASENLILDVGERQLSITQGEELRLLSLLSKTPQNKQRDVLIANFNARISGRTDEKSYYSRRFAEEFLDLHGIEVPTKTGASKKEGLASYIMQSSSLRFFAVLIGMLAGSGVLFLLADLVFNWLPRLDVDVFVKMLVVIFGCVLFAGGLGLLGISIYAISKRR